MDSILNEWKKMSKRQKEVGLLLAEGMGPDEIRRQLGVSPSTVSSHRWRVLKRLGFDRDAQLTGFAIKHRLIDVEKLLLTGAARTAVNLQLGEVNHEYQ